MVPGCVAPQENESMSVQPLCLESFDSPPAPSTFMNMQIVIFVSVGDEKMKIASQNIGRNRNQPIIYQRGWLKSYHGKAIGIYFLNISLHYLTADCSQTATGRL
jgi:hypothetical protein